MPRMATLPTTSIHDRAHADLATIITALNLQGTTDSAGNTIVGNIGANVYTQWLEDQSNIKFPCVLLLIEEDAEEEDDEAMNFEQDAIIYYSRLLICDRVSPRDPKVRGTYLLWRYIITQTLQGLVTGPFPFLPNTPECWDLRIKRLKTFDQKLPQYQFMVSGLVIGFRTVTTRWRGGVVPSS